MMSGQKFGLIQKAAIWLVMASMMLMLTNQVLFLHAHRKSDGTIVIHAHPFNSSDDADLPFKSHKHTKFDYVQLDNFTHFLAVIFVFTLIKFSYKSETPVKYTWTKCYQADVVHPSLRAPPTSY